MAAISPYDCSRCLAPYTSQQKPQILSCGHTFCEQCICNLQRCPEDDLPLKIIATNFELLDRVKDPGQAVAPMVPALIAEVRLACTICCEEYDSSERRPMALQCGHTFCEKCIPSLRENMNECPIDRRPLQLGPWNSSLEESNNPDEDEKETVDDLPPTFGKPVESLDIPLEMRASEQRQFDLQLVLCKQWTQHYIQRDEMRWPRVMPRQVRLEIERLMKEQIEKCGEKFPKQRMQAQFLRAFVQLGDSFKTTPFARGIFEEVAASNDANALDRMLSRFLWAEAELSRPSSDGVDYVKARNFLELVERAQHVFPVHRSVAKFYRALFFLKGLGGLPKSYEEARVLLEAVEGHMPSYLAKFPILLLAEMRILGLGGFDKDFAEALDMLKNCLGDDPVEGSVAMKMAYWMSALLSKKNPEAAKGWFLRGARNAPALQGKSPQQMKQDYEELFLYLAKPDQTKGRTCFPEQFLSLHLDPLSYTNVPGNQAPIRQNKSTRCVIL